MSAKPALVQVEREQPVNECAQVKDCYQFALVQVDLCAPACTRSGVLMCTNLHNLLCLPERRNIRPQAAWRNLLCWHICPQAVIF